MFFNQNLLDAVLDMKQLVWNLAKYHGFFKGLGSLPKKVGESIPVLSLHFEEIMKFAMEEKLQTAHFTSYISISGSGKNCEDAQLRIPKLIP